MTALDVRSVDHTVDGADVVAHGGQPLLDLECRRHRCAGRRRDGTGGDSGLGDENAQQQSEYPSCERDRRHPPVSIPNRPIERVIGRLELPQVRAVAQFG